jgi:hypothetical protein
MSVNVLYKTSAKATGGRDGTAATLDGALDVKLATPKELGGGGGAGNNPEQLFAAGYAACFIGAMKFVASQGGLHRRHRPAFGGRLWPRYRPRRLAARRCQGGCGSPRRQGAPGVPVLQRHPRQCGCAPDGRVTTGGCVRRCPEWPAADTGGPFAPHGISVGSLRRPRHAPVRGTPLPPRWKTASSRLRFSP